MWVAIDKADGAGRRKLGSLLLSLHVANASPGPQFMPVFLTIRSGPSILTILFRTLSVTRTVTYKPTVPQGHAHGR